MKSIVAVGLIFLALNLSAVEPQSLKHFASVPPQVRLHFTNFCLGKYDALFANNEIGFTQLASVPGLTPALLELANRLEAEQEWDGFTRAWGLMAQRTDATESEQELVRGKLESLINRNADPGGTTFKDCALTLLGHYPSPENERILKRYLSDNNGSPLSGNTTREAAESLGKIGTAASIEALRVYTEKHKPAPGGKSRYYETAVASLDQIKARVQSASPNGVNDTGKLGSPQPSTKRVDVPSAAQSEEPASTPWLVWGVLIVAAIGLLWLLLKNRK